MDRIQMLNDLEDERISDPFTGCEFEPEVEYLHDAEIHAHCEPNFTVRSINGANLMDFSPEILKRWYAHLLSVEWGTSESPIITRRNLEMAIGTGDILDHYEPTRYL